MPDIHWDSELMRRYHGAGPSLGCSPKPARLQERFGSFELLHALRDCRQQLRPLSLNVHLPFCDNACRHCQRVNIQGCDPRLATDYLAPLELEIERLARHLDPRQPVEQLIFSGGSATLFGRTGLSRLMDSLRRHFSFSDSPLRDFCIELDPRMADWSSMGMLLELGFNRIALRVDDLDPKVQQAIDRPLTLAGVRSLVEAARTLQFSSIGIELTRGLPAQTPEGFRRTLQQVLELQPDRLTLAQYHPLPGQRALQAPLPEPEQRLEILRGSVEQLQQAGYRYIGLDLFALPDDDLAAAQEEGVLRLNMHGLALQDCDQLGIGAGAFSCIGSFCSQNHEDLEHYRHSLENDQWPTWRGRPGDGEDCLQQYLRRELVCTRTLRFRQAGQDLSPRLESIWPELQRMATEGLIELNSEGLRLNASGLLLVDALCRLLRQSRSASPSSTTQLDQPAAARR